MALHDDPLGLFQTEEYDPLGLYSGVEQQKPKPEPSSILRRAGDVGISALKGAIGLPESFVGMADLVSNGQVGKAVEDAGVRFRDAKSYLDQFYSPEQQRANREVQDADGFLPTVGAMARNPSTIVNAAVESAPSVLGGWGVSRGIMGVAPKIGSTLAGAIGEGATSAGQNAEQVRQESTDGLLTPEQSGILAASGALTGAIGYGAGRLANRLGVGDIDTLGLQRNATAEVAQKAAEKGLFRRIGEGALTEGVLEELPQSYQEQVAQNLAQDKPWDEGAAKAAAQGMMAGALMGAGAGPFHGGQQEAPPQQETPPPQQEVPPTPQTLQLERNPDAGQMVVFKDGTIAYRSDFENSLAAMPDDERAATMARVMGFAPQQAVPNPAAQVGSLSAAANVAVVNGAHDIELENAVIEQQQQEQQQSQEDASAPTNDPPPTLTQAAKPIESDSNALPGPSVAQEEPPAADDAFANWTDEQLLQQFRGASSPDIRNILATELQRRREQEAQTAQPVQDEAVQQPTEEQAALPPSATPTPDQAAQPQPEVVPNAYDSLPMEQKAEVLQRVPRLVANSGGLNVIGKAMLNRPLEQMPPAIQQEISQILEPQQPQEENNGTQAPEAQQGQPQAPTSEAAGEVKVKQGRYGYDTPVTVDAKRLMTILEATRGESLVNKPAKLEAWRNGTARTDTAKFPVEIGFNSRGKLDVNDGRHRIAHAAERGESVIAFIDGKDVARFNDTVSQPQTVSTTPPTTGGIQNGNQSTETSTQQSTGQVAQQRGQERLLNTVTTTQQDAVTPPAAPKVVQPNDNQQALDRIAAGKAWFGNELKAKNWLHTNGMAETHEVKMTAPRRFEVVEKAQQEPAPMSVPDRIRAQRALAAQATATHQDPGQADIITPNGKIVAAQWDVVDADSVQASLKEGVNQPRDRSRASSNAQIKQIAQNPDWVRLSDTSKTMDYGAPTLAPDGAIVGGNGRFEGISSAYDVGTASSYRAQLEQNAQRLGLDPQTIAGMKKPVLVRRVTQDADTRTLAIQSNQPAGLQMSDMEQAALDAERMGEIDGLQVADTGDIALTTNNAAIIRNALKGYTQNELAGIMSSDGGFTPAGLRRVRNAVLHNAYGKSDVLARLIESPDPDLKNIGTALVRSAAPLAKMRSSIKSGTISQEYDIATNLSNAIGTLSQLRAKNANVQEYLNQNDMFGDGLADEEKFILQTLHDNARSAKNVTEFLRNYAQSVLSTQGAKDGLFGETKLPSKPENLREAIKRINAERAAAKSQQSIFDRPANPTEPGSGTGGSHAQAPARQGGDIASAEGNAQGTTGQQPVAEKPKNLKEAIARIQASKQAEANASQAQVATGSVASTTPQQPVSVVDKMRQKQAQSLLDKARSDLKEVRAKLDAQGMVKDDRLERTAEQLEKVVKELEAQETGQNDELDAEMRSYEDKVEQKAQNKPQSIESTQQGAYTENHANPVQTKPVPYRASDETQAGVSVGNRDSQQVGAGLAGSSARVDRSGSVPAGADKSGEAGAGRSEQSGVKPSGATRDSAGVRPESESSSDHVIDTEDIGKGGLAKKYRDNIAAIKILKTIESEGRVSTPDERNALARYVGWGALKGPFDPNNQQWSKQHAELKELLTEAEFKAARRSTLDAHYTSPVAVGAMYNAMERIGFTGGRVLEPSVGSGNFFGMMPRDMRNASQLHGVELDSLTSRIVAALYPTANIAKATGFEDFQVPGGYFDAVIGNPPFGSQPLVDAERSPYSGFSIHNYFLAKAIDKLRPGGIMQVVVSHNFLDAQDGRARKWIWDRASLIGAVRLPNTAFKDNAGTEVVTDILVFQKNVPAQALSPAGEWQKVVDQTNTNPKTGEQVTHKVNEYFVANPQNVLGTPSAAGSMYGANEYTVEQTGDIKDQLAGWVKTLPERIYIPIDRTEDMQKVEFSIPDGVKPGSFYVDASGQQVMQRGEDVMGEKTATEWNPMLEVEQQAKAGGYKSEKAIAGARGRARSAVDRMKGMIALRDSLRQQMRLERSLDATESEIEVNRAELNRLYDDFTKKYGFINDQTNRRVFLDDTESQLLQALEFDYDKGISASVAENEGIEKRAASATKADIFKRRVAFPPQDFMTVSTAKDALLASLNYRGKVDAAYMAEVYGKPIDEIANELGDVVFEDPQTGIVTADEYLSGDVKTKLAEAQDAAKRDSKYQRNVTALEKVIPADKNPSEITVSIGASWVPGEMYEQFVKHISGGTAKAKYLNATGQWFLSFSDSSDPALNTGKFGTSDLSAKDLFQLSMLGKGAVVKKTYRNPDGSTTTVLMEKETESAREKQNAIRAEWQKWIWQEEDRADKLASIYNDKMNRIVERKFDGSHMTFPGMNPAIELLAHQKNGVWRGLQTLQVLYDHVVGAGKTYQMATLAMEMRRLGIARKPVFVVPNHLTLQWRSEFTRLYPGSNVLAATPDDFSKENRSRMFSKIITGDWDAVVIGHSSLKKIGLPEATEKAVLQEQIKEISAAVEEMKRSRGDRNIIRDMEKIRSNLEAKMKDKLSAIGKRDKVVTFDELGLDALFVDEMHEFKNLTYNSTMDRNPGMGNPAGSAKAFDMFVKVRWMFDTFGAKTPFVTATGTPVSNSLVEMYNMQRYMQYPTLKANGFHVFDAWAKQFGRVENVYEVAPSGSGHRQSTRFAKFSNLPALMGLYNTFSDTITLDDLKAQEEAKGKRFPVPKIEGGRPALVVAKRSPLVADFMGVPKAEVDDAGNIVFGADLSKEISITKDDETGKYNAKVGNDFLGSFETEQDARLKLVEAAVTPVVKVEKESILGRFANLRQLTKETKGKVNALSLTGEANKAGLDYRLIDPSAPDFKGSKINLAVDKMMEVYHKWAADNGAQLVFCDLSIPLSARSSYSTKARRLYVRDEAGAIDMKRGTMHAVAGHEYLPFFVVQRGNGAVKRFDVYDASSGIRVNGDFLNKAEAVDAATGIINDDTKRQKWIDASRAREIEQSAIDDYNNDKDVETDGVESFTREDIAGVSGSSKFSVYDDIKAKLIANGVPEREIAFIHDYSTPTAKEKLFQAVNTGSIRFLLGSTPKMGAGTNVQKRLVGLHHIDAPWRPSDLEQREGRIIRRGNELYERDPDGFQIFIGRYATEQTYDTRRWQILEHKARGIEQLRNFDGSINEIDDIEGEASNAADMKAAASGDPMILEETKLRNEVRRLDQLQAGHADEVLSMRRKAKNAQENGEKYLPRQLAEVRGLIAEVKKNPLDKDGWAKIVVDGKVMAEKEAANNEIARAASMVRSGMAESAIIVFRGVEFSISQGFSSGSLVVDSPSGSIGSWTVSEALSPSGLVQRMKNYIDRLPDASVDIQARIEKSLNDAVSLRKQAQQPFAQAKDLEDARTAHTKVQRALIAKGPTVPDWQKAAVAGGIADQRAKLESMGYGDAVRELFGSQNTRFSRSTTQSPVANALPTPKVQGIVNAIKSAWKNAPDVVVVDSLEDANVPQSVRDDAASGQDAGVVDGFYHDGKVYLVADQLASAKDVARVLLHEAIGHHGLRGVFGDALTKVLNQVRIFKRQAVQDKIKEYGLDASNQEHVLQAAEEVLAEMAQTNPQIGFIRTAIAAIRTWLREHVPGFSNLGVSDAEIVRNFIAPARGFVELGKQQASKKYGVSYSRNVTNQNDVVGNTPGGRSADDSTPGVNQIRSTGLGRTDVIADYTSDTELKAHPGYKSAKYGDISSAVQVVKDLVTPENLAKAKHDFGPDATYVPVHAEEVSGRNAIPVALAYHYADQTGASIEASIVQTNRAYHTGANAMERMIARVEFSGRVTPGMTYVLVDDVSTMGSTLADLAGYIQSQGGKVSGSVVLVNAARSGKIITNRKTLNDLEARHGNEIRKLFGIETPALTASEAQYLIGFKSTDELRNRVAKARLERQVRLSAKGISESTSGSVDPSAANIAPPTDDNAIRYSRAKITGQTTRQYTPEQLKAFQNVGFQVEVPTLKERAQALWKDAGKIMVQGLVDQFAPVKDISKEAYGLLRLSKGASGAFEAFLSGGKLKLTDGVYDFDETQKGGVVDRLLKPLQGEHHDFLRWVAANRASRLMEEGRENLFTKDDISSIKTLATGDAPFEYTLRSGAKTNKRALIYLDSQEKFNEFNRNILDMAEQSGMIDGEARKVWESEFYVPFYRVADDDNGGIRGMDIKSGVVRQQAFKALKGGTQKLNADLLDNTLMNWAHLLDASAKNRAAKATIEAAEGMGLAIGADQNTLKQMASSTGNKSGIVWFMDGGNKRYSLIDKDQGPYLMTAITSLEYAGMRSPVMTAMGAFKHALTVGVTASPFFKIRNLIRDSVQAIGSGPLSYNPAKNLADGWKSTSPKSDAYFRMLASGGTIHFGTMYEGSEAKRVQALVESGVDASTILDNDNKVKAFYRKFIEPGITAYNELGNRGETINRAALYNQLVKQGVSHADAALQARDLMDFSMQGSFTTIRFLTQVVPFMNARMQGLYKLGRAAKEDPARFSAVLGATALLSLGLLAAYSDDDDWKRRTDADRNNYWWFKFGGTALRIPKPFEIGAIATLTERSFELAFEKEMTSERFRNQVMALLGDNLSMNPIPQIVKPILDVYANVDSFTGIPIESMGMEKLKSEYRFNDKTSMAARGISTAANSAAGLIGKDAPSPVKIDHLLQGYFGWLGTFVVQAGDLIARGASNQPTQASRDYIQTLTGGIFSDLRDAPSRYVGQVYEQAKAIEQAYSTWRMLLKEGKVQEAQEFRAENKDKLNRYRSIEHVKRAETSLNNRIRMIERNTSMDTDRKRELIRGLNQNKERVAKIVA